MFVKLRISGVYELQKLEVGCFRNLVFQNLEIQDLRVLVVGNLGVRSLECCVSFESWKFWGLEVLTVGSSL